MMDLRLSLAVVATIAGCLLQSTTASPTTMSPTTLAPTNPPNVCSTLRPGDIQVMLANSDNPDQIAFFTLSAIPKEVGELYVTDRPWNGTHFLDNGEGTIKMRMPETYRDVNDNICPGFCAGSIFSYGFANPTQPTWEQDVVTSRVFALATIDGDSFFMYCMDSNGKPNIINGFTYAQGGWAEAGLLMDDYGNARSALPEVLLRAGAGFVAVSYAQNSIFDALSSSNQKEELMREFADPSNYKGSNTERFTLSQLDSKTSGVNPLDIRLNLLLGLAVTGVFCVAFLI